MIFTPNEEVPFAGHPTLGTAAIIRNQILQGKPDKVTLNLKMGQIPVTFSPDGYCWMKQIQPQFGQQHPAETLAKILGLTDIEITVFLTVDERFPVEEVSTDYYGIPEDPATGSGNGCLAGYLVKHRYFGQDNINIRSEQGYEIGRPSLLLLKAEQREANNGVLYRLNIFVGGKSILVAQDEFI